MPSLVSIALIGLSSTAAFSTRELAVGSFLVLAILYLTFDAFRSGPRRDRKGRFRSKRRTQFAGLLKIGVVVGILWLGASFAGLI